MTALVGSVTNERPATPAGQHLLLDLDVLSGLLASIAIDHVETRLLTPEPPEAPKAGAPMWYGDDGVGRALLPRRRPLSQRELAAREVGDVLAGAWLQYLDFTLVEEGRLPLGQDLLPSRPHPGSFASAFRECLSALPIAGVEGARRILGTFARTVLAETSGVELPLDLDIDRLRGPFGRGEFVAHRH